MLRQIARTAVAKATAPTDAAELNYKALRFLVGLIAIALPVLTYSVTGWYYGIELTSISESYHHAGLPQSIFVGSLFAIASFLSAYVGMSTGEKWMARTAAASAVAIAVCPCNCGDYAQVTGTLKYSGLVHVGAAAIMFSILACFCLLIFFRRAIGLGKSRAIQFPWLRDLGFAWIGIFVGWRVRTAIEQSEYSVDIKTGMNAALQRAWVYMLCGVLIVIALLGAGVCGSDRCSAWPTNLYWFEFIALIAFGVSWLLAGYNAVPVEKLPAIADASNKTTSVDASALVNCRASE
jgi:hypothetical protein